MVYLVNNENELELKTQKILLQTYFDCFSTSNLVTFLTNQKNSTITKKEAVKFISLLLEVKFVRILNIPSYIKDCNLQFLSFQPELIEFFMEKPIQEGILIRKNSVFKSKLNVFLYKNALVIIEESGKIQRLKFGNLTQKMNSERRESLIRKNFDHCYVQKRKENSFCFVSLPYGFEIFYTKNSKENDEWMNSFSNIKNCQINLNSISGINYLNDFKEKMKLK